MSSLALSFHDVNFHPVASNDGQIWLSSTELAQALNYKSVKSVSNLYNSNKDEFTESMTQVIESVTVENIEVTGSVTSKRSRNLTKKTRIFSLRGCHLIAMFARTAVAKEFRKWVLDILDKEVGQPVAKTHKSERTALHEAHALLVTKTKHLNVSDAWKMIKQRFNANHIDEIPYDQIPVAVEYVHHLIALYSNAEKLKQSPNFETHAYNAASHLLWVSAWWRCFGDSIRMLNPTMASRIHDHFADGAFSASLTLGSERSKELDKRIQQDYPYMLRQCDLIDFFRHS